MDVKNNIKSAPVSCESIHISLRHFCLNRLMYHSQWLDRLLGDRPTDLQTDRRTDHGMDGWTDGKMDGCADGQRDGPMRGCIGLEVVNYHSFLSKTSFLVHFVPF